MRRLAAVVAVLALAGCHDHPNPNPTPTPSTSPSASPSVSPSASPSVSPSVSLSASPSVTPSPSPAAGFPNAASTGAPQESSLPAGPCSLAANTVYDRRDFACSRLEVRSGTIIRNSVIRGEVKGDPSGAPFTVEDSTIVGSGCVGAAAVGNSNFILRRVHIKGFNDGVRAEGPRVQVFDSLIEICFSAGGHADGLQVCPSSAGCGGSADTSGLVFNHNTVTHPKADSTGAVFVMGGSAPSQITNNLLAGFSITLRVHAPATVTGNRLVDGSWLYGPTACEGFSGTWSDNRLVTLGQDYAIAATLGEVRC